MWFSRVRACPTSIYLGVVREGRRSHHRKKSLSSGVVETPYPFFPFEKRAFDDPGAQNLFLLRNYYMFSNKVCSSGFPSQAVYAGYFYVGSAQRFRQPFFLRNAILFSKRFFEGFQKTTFF